MTNSLLSNVEIEDLLIDLVAHYGRISPTSIDVAATFDELGLGSQEAVAITGDLEDRLGIEISPTLAWEYPTLEQMARFLSESKVR
jgi:acyl carrier protein